MSDFSVSSRYANAFISIGIEKKILEKLFQDFLLIKNTFKNSKELKAVLKNPTVREEKKIAILTVLFNEKIQNETQDFLVFMVTKRRETFIEMVATEFINIYNEKMGLIEAEVYSAVKLDNNQISVLSSKVEKLTGKKINLNPKIKEELIGGFLLKIQDTVYDASIKRQLELLKNQLLTEN